MRAFVLQEWLSCWAGWEKITYHCLPTDAVGLKVLLSCSRSLNLSFQISDIFLDTTYISGVACEN